MAFISEFKNILTQIQSTNSSRLKNNLIYTFPEMTSYSHFSKIKFPKFNDTAYNYSSKAK